VVLDGSTTWSKSVSFGPTETAYSFAVTSKDLAGNVSAATTVSITLDQTAPSAPVLTPAPTLLVNTTTLTLAGTKDANTAIWVNGAQVLALTAGTSWSTPVNLPVEGNNTFSITAVDAASNVSTATAVTIVRDTLAPAVPAVNPVTSPTNVASQTLSGTKDANSSIWINGVQSVPADALTTWSVSVSYTASDGIYAFNVTSKDAVGNQSVATTVSIELDQTAPAVPLGTNWPGAAVSTSSYGLTGSKSADSSLWISVNGAPAYEAVTLDALATWSATVSLINGTNTIVLSSRDLAGNTATDTTHSIVTTSTAPASPVVNAVTSPTTGASQILTGTKTANTAIWISVNAAAAYEAVVNDALTTWSATVSLVEGANAIVVTAKDGSLPPLESGPVNLNIVKDTTPPTSPTVGVTTPTNQASQVISGTREANSAVWISLNGGTAYQAVSLGASTSWSATVNLVEGSNSLSITAKDLVGNTSNPTYPATTATIVRDSTPPALPTVNAVSSPTNVTTQALSGTKDANSSIWVNGVQAVAANTNTTWSSSAFTLTEGANTFLVTSKDALGNGTTAVSVTILLDTIAPTSPTVTVTSPTALASQLISGTRESNSAVWISINSGTAFLAAVLDPATAWSATVNLVEGTNTLSITAQDQVGNTSNPTYAATMATIVRDSTPPAIPGVNAVTSPTNVTTQALSGTKDANSSIWVAHNANPAAEMVVVGAATTWSTTAYTLVEGNNTFSVTSRDALGNASAPVSVTIVLDTTAPTAPTLAAVTTPTTSATQIISGTRETDSAVWISINGGAAYQAVALGAATAWSATVNLVEGTNTLSITARDLVGNTSNPTYAVTTGTIVLDSTPPALPVVNPVSSPTALTTQALSGTKDANSSIWVAHNTNPAAEMVAVGVATTWSTTAYTLVEGANTFSVTSRDALGNETAPVVVTITLDTIAPTTPVINAVVSPTNQTTQTLSGTKEANTSLWINGAQVIALNALTTWSSAQNLTIEGNNTFSVTAKDSAGNTSAAASATIVRDTTAPAAPTVTVVTPVNTTPQTISGTKDANSSILINGIQAVAVDALTTWSAPVTLTVGTNNFTLTSKDALGNTSAGVNTSIVLDTTAPTQPGIDPVLSPTNAGSQTLTGTKETNTAIYINGVLAFAMSAGTTWNSLQSLNTEGNNTFNVVARDAAGNNSTTATVTIVKDTTLPATPVVTTVNAVAVTPPVTLLTKIGTLSLAGTRVEAASSIWVDNGTTNIQIAAGGALTTWSGTYTLAQGLNTLSVTAVDAAGNISAGSVSLTVTLDTIAPAALTIAAPVSGGPSAYSVTSAATTYTISGVCETGASIAMTGSATGSTTCAASAYSLAITPTAGNATFNFSLTQTDAAGNTSPAVTLQWIRISAGTTVSPLTLSVNETVTNTATFTVALNTMPSADVIIGVKSLDTTEAWVQSGSNLPLLLTFTQGNWNVPQTVTVYGQNDSLADGTQNITVSVYVSSTTDTTGYSIQNPADVAVTVFDTQAPGITVAPLNLLVSEAATTATFTVKLNTAPAVGNQVVIRATSLDTTEGTVSPATLAFTNANWSAAQTVTVTGVDDAVQDGSQTFLISTTVDATTSAGETNYLALNPADVSVTNADNDTVGVTVMPVSGLTTSEGITSTSAMVVLNTAPNNTVVLDVTSTDLTEVVASTSQLTFTAGNWNLPQTLTFTGVDDSVADGNIAVTVTLNINAVGTLDTTGYKTLNVGDLTVTNLDNDQVGFSVVPLTGLIVNETGNGTTATFTVALQTQPNGNVVVNVASIDTTEAVVDKSALTFTTADWSTPQTVTVTGVADALADGNQTVSILLTVNTSTAVTTDTTGYIALNPADPSVTVRDTNVARYTVTPTVLTTSESGTSATFSVSLNTQPTGNVVVLLASQNTGEVVLNKSSLTFTALDWQTPQGVMVTGVPDGVADGNKTVIIATVTDTANTADTSYLILDPPNVTVTNLDTTPTVTLSPATSLQVSETGTTASVNVVLNSQPNANVVLTLTPGAASPSGRAASTEMTLSTSTLTFTPMDWQTPQTVTVTGVNDTLIDGNQTMTVSWAVSTSDTTGYAAVTPTALTVVNQDDETRDFILSRTTGLVTSESGGTDTFTVSLTTIPNGTVIVNLTSGNTGEVTVSPSTLTFSATDYFVAQTVTVTGVNDTSADGNVLVNVTVAVSGSSADTTGYKALASKTVSVTNNDNEPVNSGSPTSPTPVPANSSYSAGVATNGASYFTVTGLTTTTTYLIGLFDLTDKVSLEVFSDTSFASNKKICSDTNQANYAGRACTTLPNSFGELFIQVSSSPSISASYILRVVPLPTYSGAAGAPTLIANNQLPYWGGVGANAAGQYSYYKLSGLTPSASYYVKVLNLTGLVTLEVFSDSWTTLGCSSGMLGTASGIAEACTATSNLWGDLYVRIANVGSVAAVAYQLAIQTPPVTVGTATAPISILPQNLPYESGEVGATTPSYYKVTGLSPGITYKVSLTSLTENVTLNVYQGSGFTGTTCSSANNGKAPENCSLATSATLGDLYIKVTPAASLQAAFKINVQ